MGLSVRLLWAGRTAVSCAVAAAIALFPSIHEPLRLRRPFLVGASFHLISLRRGATPSADSDSVGQRAQITVAGCGDSGRLLGQALRQHTEELVSVVNGTALRLAVGRSDDRLHARASASRWRGVHRALRDLARPLVRCALLVATAHDRATRPHGLRACAGIQAGLRFSRSLGLPGFAPILFPMVCSRSEFRMRLQLLPDTARHIRGG